jgi:hypothetical protein
MVVGVKTRSYLLVTRNRTNSALTLNFHFAFLRPPEWPLQSMKLLGTVRIDEISLHYQELIIFGP